MSKRRRRGTIAALLLAMLLSTAACSSDSEMPLRAEGSGTPTSDRDEGVDTTLGAPADVSDYRDVVDSVFERVSAQAFAAAEMELRGEVQAGPEPGEWVLCLMNTAEMPIPACDSEVVLPQGAPLPRSVEGATDPRLIEAPAVYRGALTVVDGDAVLEAAVLVSEPEVGVSRTARMCFEVVEPERAEPSPAGRKLAGVAFASEPTLVDRSAFEAILGDRLGTMGLPILGAIPVQEEGEARVLLSGVIVPRELARALAEVLGLPVSIASPIVLDTDGATTCN